MHRLGVHERPKRVGRLRSPDSRRARKLSSSPEKLKLKIKNPLVLMDDN